MPAILDLGTNTFHLLIARFTAGVVHEMYEEQIPVKIGAGGIENGIITPQAWQRALQALQHFHQMIAQYGQTEVLATGTSAIRNASNGAAFLELVRTQFGFNVQQIDGDTEAKLIYLGVRHSFTLPNNPVLVMDIGGGSVEFIIGKREHIYWKQSFEIGAARLLQRFAPSDILQASEEKAIMDYLSQQLMPLTLALDHVRRTETIDLWVGSAGSFETFRDVMNLDLGNPLKAYGSHAWQAGGEELEQYFNYILYASLQQRKQMRGLVDFRQDMIVVASLLMKWVWTHCAVKECMVSRYALKEGLLINMTNSI